MYYSEVIWKMFRFEGKTIPQIISYFDNPLITKEYVHRVLENVQFLRKFPRKIGWKKLHKKVGPPEEGTLIRVVYDKIEALGGPQALEEILKNKYITVLAREWGVKWQTIVNYRRDYITGRRYEARFRAQIRTELTNRKVAGIRRKGLPNNRRKKDLW